MNFRELKDPPKDFRIWGAVEPDIQYVIVLDLQVGTYSASYKMKEWNNKKPAAFLGSELDTFDRAKDLCLLHQASISTRN